MRFSSIIATLFAATAFAAPIQNTEVINQRAAVIIQDAIPNLKQLFDTYPEVSAQLATQFPQFSENGAINIRALESLPGDLIRDGLDLLLAVPRAVADAGLTVLDKGISVAGAVFDKGISVLDKGISAAGAVFDKGVSVAGAVFDKGISAAGAVLDKGISAAGVVKDAALSGISAAADVGKDILSWSLDLPRSIAGNLIPWL